MHSIYLAPKFYKNTYFAIRTCQLVNNFPIIANIFHQVSLTKILFMKIIYLTCKHFQKQRHILFIWFFVRGIVVVMLFVRFIHDCIRVRSGGVSGLIVTALTIFFDMYCAFVVWCFWKEVTTGESGGKV